MQVARGIGQEIVKYGSLVAGSQGLCQSKCEPKHGIRTHSMGNDFVHAECLPLVLISTRHTVSLN